VINANTLKLEDPIVMTLGVDGLTWAQ